MFGILTRHYPAVFEISGDATGQVDSYSSLDLAAVVPSDLLGAVEDELARRGESFADASLKEIIELLRRKMLEAMDAPWSQVTYHLHRPRTE